MPLEHNREPMSGERKAEFERKITVTVSTTKEIRSLTSIQAFANTSHATSSAPGLTGAVGDRNYASTT